MSMSAFHLAVGVNLLAASAGGFLIYLAKKENFCGLKKLGFVVVLVAFGSLLCNAFFGFRDWRAGRYDASVHGAGGMMMNNCPMMDGMMKNGMMKDGMPMNQDSIKPSAPTNPKSDDHSAHH